MEEIILSDYAITHGRRSHRKSRNGCLQCKRRKVKCDERKPGCRKCQVHGIALTCTYPAVEDPTPTASATATPTSSPPPPRSVKSQPLPLFSLELLHFWTTETAQTLSARPEVHAMWRDHAPQVGFSAPFVMHAILTVAALHLSRRCAPERKQQCLDEAHANHIAAVKIVAPNISRLVEEHGTAVILFSWLTCVHTCGRPRTRGDLLIVGREDGPAEWLTQFRGNKVILDSSNNAFRAGILAPVFSNGARNSNIRWNMRIDDGEEWVGDLRRLILSQGMGVTETKMYMDAVDLLGKSFAVVIGGEGSMVVDATVVMAWMLEVSDEYLERLRRREAVALVIYAYFSVLVKRLEWMWWLDGLSEKFMSELWDALDERCRDWLRWPIEEIGWSPQMDEILEM